MLRQAHMTSFRTTQGTMTVFKITFASKTLNFALFVASVNMTVVLSSRSGVYWSSRR